MGIHLATHSGQLERWLGKEPLEQISDQMKDWYGPPIALAGVPGKVFAHRGGDFRGTITTGKFASAWCAIEKFGRSVRKVARAQSSQVNSGFGSFADIVAEAIAGKTKTFLFNKVGPSGVLNVTSTLWQSTGVPAAGSAATAAPGGRVPDSTTTGAYPFSNPISGDTQHFVSGYASTTSAGTAGNTLLLYDRIFDVAKTMNSTATEAVTGTPTRYQGTSGTGADYAGGNFLFVEVQTVLPATAHNWTVCQYTNQAGTGGQTLPSLTGNSSAIVQRLDHPTSQFYAPLATGDTGIQALTQMQCSAAVATGAINFVIGHPIAWFPVPIVGLVCSQDGVFTAFNLMRIFDSACLTFLEVVKPATTATTYTGMFQTVSG